MQYSININQLVLAETTLDLLDSAILTYMTVICASVNPAIEKSRKNGYTWINYSHLLREMPLLRIKSTGAITPRINKIKENGFILTQKIGKRLYVKPTSKIDELFVKQNDGKDPSFTNMNDTVHEYERSSFTNMNESLELKNDNTMIPAKSPKPGSKDIEGFERGLKIVRTKKITEIIDAFRKVNPMLKFGNKTERAAAEELIDKFGNKNAVNLAIFAASVQGKEYAPTITTPYELVKKIGKLKVYFDKENNKKSKGMMGNYDEAIKSMTKKYNK